MERTSKQQSEIKIIEAISDLFPTFLGGVRLRIVANDPPDFISDACEGEKNRGRIGLELTRWLDARETGDSVRRDRVRRTILDILGPAEHSHPLNIRSVVLFPRWEDTIARDHRSRFREEFYRALQHLSQSIANRRQQHWRELNPAERFDCEVRKNDLKAFPNLLRYIESIWFQEGFPADRRKDDDSWLSCIPDGGFYDRSRSVDALRAAIEKKTLHYSDSSRQEHLRQQALEKLILIVYADPENFGRNTPYQSGEQMSVSPVEGLEEVTRAAIDNLRVTPKLFDAVYLYYPMWNSRWLAKIWPDFRRIPANPEKAYRASYF